MCDRMFSFLPHTLLQPAYVQRYLFSSSGPTMNVEISSSVTPVSSFVPSTSSTVITDFVLRCDFSFGGEGYALR